MNLIEAGHGIEKVDEMLSQRKEPTREKYLQIAMRLAAELETRRELFLKNYGIVMPEDSASNRFLGKAMWHNLMGWAGFPMWIMEDEV